MPSLFHHHLAMTNSSSSMIHNLQFRDILLSTSWYKVNLWSRTFYGIYMWPHAPLQLCRHVKVWTFEARGRGIRLQVHVSALCDIAFASLITWNLNVLEDLFHPHADLPHPYRIQHSFWSNWLLTQGKAESMSEGPIKNNTSTTVCYIQRR